MRISLHMLIAGMLIWGSAKGQIPGVDTLFKANDLIYFSEVEKDAFHEFFKGEPDYLAMICALNPSTDERELKIYREWLDDVANIIRDKKFDKLSEEKKIEHITKYVSKTLLIQYQHAADFSELFRYGSFNYITAAAIYSFLLDRLGIPYEIHELPTHLYLMAYPETKRIRFETSKPGHQYFMPDHEIRTNFVDYLHKQGVIDTRTYQNNSIRDLFQQYYFAGYSLSIQNMIGMLYLNSAIELIVDEKNVDSYSQMEKAYILHPSYKSQYMLLLELNRYLLNMDYHNPLHLGYLIKASRLIDFGISREVVEDFLSDIVYTVLVKEEDRESFMYIYKYLMEFLRDKELKNEFSFLYLYESGRMEFNQNRYGKALDFFESAYQIKPDDEDVSELLTRSLAGYYLNVSPAIVLEKIQLFDSSYTAVTQEELYKVVKIQTFLQLFGEAFQLQDGVTGERYMFKFEKLLSENPEAEIDQQLIGRSYSSAAIYYYRSGQVKKSRQVN